MSSLQTLVQSIVTDLINARFEADVKAAELAEVYRDHPVLRNMAVPTLNISNVSVDLKVAFNEDAIEDDPGPSEEQTKAVSEAASDLRTRVMEMKSVTDTVTVARQKSTLSRSLQTAAASAANANLKGSPKERQDAVDKEITKVLTANKVQLNAADRRALAAGLGKFDGVIASAPKAPPKVPRIMVGAEALSKLGPERVTTISFDIDLSRQQWTDTADGQGGTRTVLRDR